MVHPGFKYDMASRSRSFISEQRNTNYLLDAEVLLHYYLYEATSVILITVSCLEKFFFLPDELKLRRQHALRRLGQWTPI